MTVPSTLSFKDLAERSKQYLKWASETKEAVQKEMFLARANQLEEWSLVLNRLEQLENRVLKLEQSNLT